MPVIKLKDKTQTTLFTFTAIFKKLFTTGKKDVSDRRKPRRTDLQPSLAQSYPGISYLVGEECKYMVVLLSQNKEIG